MKRILILTVLIMQLLAVSAQPSAKDWTKTFVGNINWYRITDAGILAVATKDGLYGINPQDGSEVWKQDDIENIKEENYDPIEGTPYIVLSKSGLMKNSIKILDVVTGKSIADSKELGFMNVQKRLYLKMTNSILLFGIGKTGKPTLTKVNLSDASVAWSQEKIFDKNTEQIVSEAGETTTALFIATDKRIYKLDPITGALQLEIDIKSDLPVIIETKKKNPFGAIAGGFNTSKGLTERTTNTSADFFQTEEKDKVYFWNQDYLTCFAIADGKELWKRVKLPSPVANILFDKRGLMLFTAEKSKEDMQKANDGGGGIMGKIKSGAAAGKDRSKVLLLDYATGAEKWSGDVDIKGDLLAYKLVDSKLIFASQKDNGDNYINVLDMNLGKGLTKKPLNLKGEIQDLQLMPQGLYYRTNEEINILDLESGQKIWKKGMAVKSCVGYNKSAARGYVYANDKIYNVNFEKGEIDELVTSVNFEGKEDASSLQIRPNGILLTSSQNATLYSEEGKVIWHSYAIPPGRTMAGKLLSGLGGLSSALIGAGAAAQSAQLSYSKGYYGSTSPELDGAIQRNNDLASAGMSSAIASFKSIARRFKASREADNFMSMLTNFGNSNMAKDAGIVLIGKNDGKEIRKVILGDKKDPDYKLDELGRVIYFRSGGNEIQGFSF